MRPTLRTPPALLLISAPHAPAATPQEKSRPAFTPRDRLTVQSEDSEKIVLDEPRHVSADGNFRSVTTREDGSASRDWFDSAARRGRA